MLGTLMASHNGSKAVERCAAAFVRRAPTERGSQDQGCVENRLAHAVCLISGRKACKSLKLCSLARLDDTWSHD